MVTVRYRHVRVGQCPCTHARIHTRACARYQPDKYLLRCEGRERFLEHWSDGVLRPKKKNIHTHTQCNGSVTIQVAFGRVKGIDKEGKQASCAHQESELVDHQSRMKKLATAFTQREKEQQIGSGTMSIRVQMSPHTPKHPHAHTRTRKWQVASNLGIGVNFHQGIVRGHVRSLQWI